MDIGSTIREVRKEYKEYLEEKHLDWSDNTVRTHVSDAFYIWNNTLLPSFWKTLVNDESMEKGRLAIYDHLKNTLLSDRAEVRTKGYFADLSMLKEFLDSVYGGVKKRVGYEIDCEKTVYKYVKMAYDGELTIEQAVQSMAKEVTCFNETSHKLTVLFFIAMMKGERYTRRGNTETMLYFINQIGVDYGKDYMVNALKATRENVKYYYEQTGNKSNSICRGCRKIAADNAIENIRFDDSVFDGIIPKKNITDDILSDKNTDAAKYTDDAKEFNAMFEDDTTGEEGALAEKSEDIYDIYTKDDFLQDVYMSEERYNTLVNLLLIKKNIILQGAPGVGKTYVAKRLAYSIMGEKDNSRVKMVQFHQSYSYEDFIMGFRPTQTGFELKKGVFYEFCKKAEDDDRPYFFIIDEINRGNLSKIFGELFMLIENDKRGVELQLLYAEEQFSIPSNVYIIGMMNTADRSLAMLDYALRRRFAFFDIVPAFDSTGFRAYRKNVNNPKYDKLISAVQQLNEMIINDESLGEGFCIGHSYFCTNVTINDEWLKSVVEFEIVPLLKEYWFDEPSKVRNWTNMLREVIK